MTQDISVKVVSQPIAASVSAAGIKATVGSSTVTANAGHGVGPRGEAGPPGPKGDDGDSTSDPRWSLFLPAPPSNVVAVGNVGSVSLAWSQTYLLIETPVTNYVVQYRADSGGWQTFDGGESSERYAVVTGLTNGVAYTFRVKAVSEFGETEYSDASNSATPTQENPSQQTELLIHFDGDGSAFVDSSSMSHSVVAVGGVVQTSSDSVFGAKSGSFFGGHLTVDSIGLSIYDFAVELFFKTTTAVPYTALVSQSVGYFDQGAWIILLNNSSAGSGDVAVYAANYSTSSPLLSSSTFAANDGNWHHLAVVRDSGVFSMYLDGVRVAVVSFGGATGLAGGSLEIGTDKAYAGRDFVGSMDELRIVRGGNGGYTGASITVPTSAF